MTRINLTKSTQLFQMTLVGSLAEAVGTQVMEGTRTSFVCCRDWQESQPSVAKLHRTALTRIGGNRAERGNCISASQMNEMPEIQGA
jgi:hypothetical protein